MPAVSTSCSVSDTFENRAAFKPSKPAFITEKTIRKDIDVISDFPKVTVGFSGTSGTSNLMDCSENGKCPPVTHVVGSTTPTNEKLERVDIETVDKTISDSSSNSSPESGLRAGNSVSQISARPNDDLNLVQLPNEENYQAVNSIWTSKLPQNIGITQSAEYRNVIFNQLDSPDALHTINSTRHDDPSKSGSLSQSFKFKNIEMIQRNVGDGIHTMNYIGN